MPVVSSIFLVAALVLGVVIGPQTRPWSWGPAMLALGIATAAALPAFWSKKRQPADFGFLAFALFVAGWFAWRAWISPVAELGQADLMLLAGAVGSFVSIRAIEGNVPAERILVWGIALLLLANVLAVGKQLSDPAFCPLFRSRTELFPSGFYAHYNEAANFLIASSLLVGAAALFGKEGAATRIFWGLVAVAGLAAVYFTRSRGGILGAALGTGVFACAALVVGKRSGARWFSPALIAIPVIGVAISMFLFNGWKGSQELRNAGVGIDQVLDSNYRLYFLGLATSCIGLHPMIGGGSRSFSWESFRFYEGSVQGSAITRRPEQVHNELLQAATDYGLIGAGLLAVLLGALVVIAVVRILFSESSRESTMADAWRVGALAALAGMFVQSSFSFVFHLFPGVLLLGICLGKMCRASPLPEKSLLVTGAKTALSAASIACVFILLPLGWKGTQVTKALWATYFSKLPATSSETQIDALTEAIRIWPQSDFLTERAGLYRAAEEPANDESIELATRDYAEAERLHSHDPGIAVNLANLLSSQQKDQEAEAAYNRAIQLQGGMEPAFLAHYSLATHLMQKARRQFEAKQLSPALESLEVAARQIEQSVKEMRWVAPNVIDTRVSVHESLGTAREADGDLKGAMEVYDFACTLPGGSRANYRAGILFGKMAADAWAKRKPSEALGYFIKARERISAAKELPLGVSPSQRVEYLSYLDQTIAFLNGAKIEPSAAK